MKILFILQDALRPDRLGCYGYRKNTSPHIDRLAREGVLFQNCIAVSTHTFPPIVSINTGCNIATHGLMGPLDYERWKNGAWQNRRTPLHVLRDAGFQIDGELVSRWHPLGFTRDTETEKIENYFEDNRDGQWYFFAEPYQTHLPYNPPPKYLQMFWPDGYAPDEDTRARLDIVKSKMIIHPPDVMSAFEAGEEDAIGQGDEAHRRSAAVVSFAPEKDKPGVDALYDGEVRVFDDLVGRWISKLEALDILDETLIIISSDHGEELLERGHIGHTSCCLKGTLFDECLKVPLIIRYPRALPAGKKIEHQISQIDIMPTIFDVLDLPIPTPADGDSLLPLIRGEANYFRAEAYAETIPAGWQALRADTRRMWCVRTRNWKLILHTDTRGAARHYELFDLRSDVGETKNIYPQKSAEAEIIGLQNKLDSEVLKKLHQQ
jgi:arylsulfatase A-like enzyme